MGYGALAFLVAGPTVSSSDFGIQLCTVIVRPRNLTL